MQHLLCLSIHPRVYDATEQDGYLLKTQGFGDVWYNLTSDFKTRRGSIENVWLETDESNAELIPLLKGPGMIPSVVTIFAPVGHFGAFYRINNAELTIAPPAQLSCDMIDGDEVIEIDPAGTGQLFSVRCRHGKTLLRSTYYSYSVYYDSCGGVADADCVPTSAQGCYGETIDGYISDHGCNRGPKARSKSNRALLVTDEFGNTLPALQLDALANTMDSSWCDCLHLSPATEPSEVLLKALQTF